MRSVTDAWSSAASGGDGGTENPSISYMIGTNGDAMLSAAPPSEDIQRLP